MALPMQQYGPQAQPLPGGGSFLQTPRFTPEQSQIMQNLAQMGAQNFNFAPIEQREQKRFQQETIPGLAERFTAMGGGQKSSAFQGALGQAGADLGERLAALRANLGAQQLQLGLQPQFESALQPSPYQGGLRNLLGGLGAAAPGLIEAGAKYALGGHGGSTPAQQPQAAGIGNAIGALAPAVAGAAGTAAAGGFGGALSGLGTGLAAAAAPFALPALAAGAVIGLPFLLNYLLED